MKVKVIFLTLLAVFCFGPFIGAPSAGAADVLPIVQVGPLVYADTAGHLFVVAVRGSSESGLFVVYSPKGIPVQQFTPEQLPPEAVLLFLAYEPQKNAYTKVIVSEEHIYTVQGSVRIALGPDSWMGVDTFNNPYCSFVLERQGQKPTILSFVGTEKVVLAQGEKPVAILAATQSLEGYKSFVDEYTLTKRGLLLKGQPLITPQIGIQVFSNNTCFGQNAILLTQTELSGFQAISDPGKRQLALEEIKKRHKQLLESLIPVKINEKEITGYQPDKQMFVFVEKRNEKINDQAVCLFSSADL